MKAPSFYRYLHLKLLELADKDKEISVETAVIYMAGYNIPRKLRKIILGELRLYGLIDIQNDIIIFKAKKKGDSPIITEVVHELIFLPESEKNFFNF